MINDKRVFLELLKEIKKNNITTFKPTITAGIGFHYKELEFEFRDFDEQIKFLNVLDKMGIVESKDGISIIRCNSCSGITFSLRYICSYCKSFNVKSGMAIEHDICHNIDFEDNYLKLDGSLKCAKCNKTLKVIGVDYSKISIFKCSACNGISSALEQQYTCLTCSKTLVKTELSTSNLIDYSVSHPKLLSSINDLEYLIPVVEELNRLGINSRYPSSAKGISGITHSFDLIAYDKSNKPILILETIDSLNESENFYGSKDNLVLSFIGKCSDFNIPYKILALSVQVSENIINLLKINNIIVLKISNKEESIIDIVQTIFDLFKNLNEEATFKNE
jgi:hypothetical protein